MKITSSPYALGVSSYYFDSSFVVNRTMINILPIDLACLALVRSRYSKAKVTRAHLLAASCWFPRVCRGYMHAGPIRRARTVA